MKRRLSENQKRGGRDFWQVIDGTTNNGCSYRAQIWDRGDTIEADVTYGNGKQSFFTTHVDGIYTIPALCRLLSLIRG